MEETTKTEDSGFPIRFRIPTRMPSVIAQHLTVQPVEDGILLSFYEVIPPLFPTDLSEEQIKQLKETGVMAECVSKVFVPNSRYLDFLDAMEIVLPDDEEDEDIELEKDK